MNGARYRVFRAKNGGGPQQRRNWHLVDRALGIDGVYQSFDSILSVLRGECPADEVRRGVQLISSMSASQMEAVLGMRR